MNAIMACDEASKESEFLSPLNAFLAHFVNKTLKAEQVECIRRIVCHGRDVLAVLPTGFGKSAIYQLIVFNLGRTANAVSKTTVAVVRPLDHIRNQQVASIEKMDCGICTAAIGELIHGETARSKMESSILCLEVLNNGLAIVAEKRCSLAHFIRQKPCLSMKCIL